ncbi:hypothetical protein Hanom_Chr11g01030791 [Helianthus anomalus]
MECNLCQKRFLKDSGCGWKTMTQALKKWKTRENDEDDENIKKS